MRLTWKETIAFAVLVAIFTSFTFYSMFVEGTTDGPDFIQAIQTGSVAAGAISSIEVVEPANGHTPFKKEEYDSLIRRAKIDSTVSISRVLSLLKTYKTSRIQQNHPSSSHHAYLKVNTQGSFYWLYLEVHEDANRSVLEISANTRNATNPNEASTYYLEHFSEVLSILENIKSTEPDSAAKGSQPLRSE